MKKGAFIILMTLLSLNVFSQKIVKDKHFGISITEPKNWISAPNHNFLDSLLAEKNSNDDLIAAIEDNGGSLLLNSFYKFNPNKGGFVPIIQINVLNNPAESFEDFQADMKESANIYKSIYADYSFVKEPELTTVNDNKAIYFSGKFTINGKKNFNVKMTTKTLNINQNYKIFAVTEVYAIPYGAYFFQVSFTHEQGNEEDAKLFDALVKSIKIGR